jgi:hypothetical protein
VQGAARWLPAVAGSVLGLSGCWAPPAAVLRPDAPPPGPLGTVRVTADVSDARVEAVDCTARTVTLGGLQTPGTFQRGQRVRDRDWQKMAVGDAINARIRLELRVYIPQAGPPAGPSEGAGRDGSAPAARVLLVDPSYRLLTLQFPDHSTQIFKVALHTPLGGVTPGASVDLRPLTVTSLTVHGHRRSAQTAGACAPAGPRP